jgi:hypothetical protein
MTRVTGNCSTTKSYLIRTLRSMPSLPDLVDPTAEQHGFAGVVRVNRGGTVDKMYPFA